MSRRAYVRRAIERMNKQTLALVRAKRLVEASKKVSKESLRVNREFAAVETLCEDAIDIEAFDKRSKEPTRSFKQVLKSLKRDRLLPSD